MGKFFNRSGNKPDNGQTSGEGKPITALPLRLLAIGYLVYLIYQMIKPYTDGTAETPATPVFWICVLALSLGTLLIILLTYRQWRQQKDSEQETLPE